MLDKREEKIVVFEKFDDTTNPNELPLKLYDEIKDRMVDYVSHSLRAYKYKDAIYVAAEVTFKRKDSTPPTTIVDYSLKHSQDGDIASFGEEPNVNEVPAWASYSIYDMRQLYLLTQRKLVPINQLNGELLLNLGKEKFLFKNMDFPMTRFLFGVAGEVSQQTGLSIKSPFRVKAEANFVQPDWFEQAEGDRIIASGSNVSEFFNPKLVFIWPPKSSKSIPPLTLKEVVIDIHELICYRRSCSEKHKSTSTEWEHRKLNLSHHICERKLQKMRRTFSADCISFNIPPATYDCKLPKLGCTYFSPDQSRSYAIEISYVLEGEDWESPVHLSCFSEVYVARRDYPHIKRHLKSPLPCFVKSFRDYHSLTSIEWFSRDNFCPLKIAKEKFRELASARGLLYKAHQTDVFVFNGDFFAVTKIDASIPISKLSWRYPEVSRRQLLPQFGEGPKFDPRQRHIICEVVGPSSVVSKKGKNALIGGLFLRGNGRRFQYEFPLNCPSSTGPADGLYSRITETTINPLRNGRHLHLVLACAFKIPSGFIQSRGENIVLPGMNLEDFLMLELQLPFSFLKYEPLHAQDLKFNISRIEIQIAEEALSNSPHNVGTRVRTKTILEKKVNKSFSWSEFQKVKGSSTVTLVIPPDLYSCEIPNLGPTFYSNIVYRCYEVCVFLRICVAGRQEILFVKHEINVAVTSQKNQSLVLQSIQSNKSTPSIGAISDGKEASMISRLMSRFFE